METAVDPKNYVTRREAADALGVSVQTIDNYARAGRITTCKVGPRLIRIPRSDVERLLLGALEEAVAPVSRLTEAENRIDRALQHLQAARDAPFPEEHLRVAGKQLDEARRLVSFSEADARAADGA